MILSTFSCVYWPFVCSLLDGGLAVLSYWAPSQHQQLWTIGYLPHAVLFFGAGPSNSTMTSPWACLVDGGTFARRFCPPRVTLSVGEGAATPKPHGQRVLTPRGYLVRGWAHHHPGIALSVGDVVTLQPPVHACSKICSPGIAFCMISTGGWSPPSTPSVLLVLIPRDHPVEGQWSDRPHTVLVGFLFFLPRYLIILFYIFEDIL